MDTSSDACSVAIGDGDRVVARHVIEPRRHRELVLPFVRELLAETDTALSELDGIVLGNGPGSFIGLRIAASVAQGLAFAAGLEILPVCSLAAIAAEAAAADREKVVVAQDARLEQLYVATFGPADFSRPDRVALPSLTDVAAFRPEEVAAATVVAGDAWYRYPQLRRALPDACEFRDVTRPDARWLLKLGARLQAAGCSVAAEDVVLSYVRQRVAEPSQALTGAARSKP